MVDNIFHDQHKSFDELGIDNPNRIQNKPFFDNSNIYCTKIILEQRQY